MERILKSVQVLTIRSLIIFLFCFAGQVFSQKSSTFLNGQFFVKCDTLVITIENTSENKAYLADLSKSRTQQVYVDPNGSVVFIFFTSAVSTSKEKEQNTNIFLGAIEVERGKNLTLKYLIKKKKKIKEVQIEYCFSYPIQGNVREMLELKKVVEK